MKEKRWKRNVKMGAILLLFFALFALGIGLYSPVQADRTTFPVDIKIVDHSELNTSAQCNTVPAANLKKVNKKVPKRPQPPDPKKIKKLMKEHNLQKYALSTKDLEPGEIEKLLPEFESEGISVLIDTPDFRCDTLYEGWVQDYMSDVWWFAYACQGSPTGCTRNSPSESTKCDIHYESDMYFSNPGADTTRGLIDFPGCKPAKNCRSYNYCGEVNTKLNGACGLEYSDIPWNYNGYWMYGYYMMSKNPCPHGDCSGKNPNYYPQVMMLDITDFWP